MDDGQEYMHVEYIGGIKIYRPNATSELKLRLAIENHLRSTYSVGKYTKKEDINAILQHQFKFYADRLNQLVPPIASRGFLEFLLYQFDIAAELEDLRKNKALSDDEYTRWSRLGPKFRRGIKYLAERVTLLQPKGEHELQERNFIPVLDEIWICAEEMVELYLLSDQTYAVFPDHSKLEILPPGGVTYYDLSVNRKDIFPTKGTGVFQETVRRDTTNRNSIIGNNAGRFLVDSSHHNDFLEDPMQRTIGVSYLDAISILVEVIDGCQPLPDAFPVPFCKKEDILNTIARNKNISTDVVNAVLNGFLLTQENMTQDGREVWKPKQEYRAYRRGFFELPHPDGVHIIFSKSMARECLITLISDTPFQKIPPEWNSKSVQNGLATLSNEVGDWFEKVVEDNFKKISITGICSAKSQIGQGKLAIHIPDDVGEIDFLGYSNTENLLVIGECKIVNSGFEGKFFRDDIDQFVNKKKSYSVKFRKKIDWVKKNAPAICKALDSTKKFSTPISPTHLASVMVTFFPNITEYFINDFPCVSITNLMLDHQEKGEWPYTKGLFDL